MPTQKEIAAILNISRSTVSSALNNGLGLNPETRRRVLEMANKLNYENNVFATSMRKGASNFIGHIHCSGITIARESLLKTHRHIVREGYYGIDLHVEYPEVENESLGNSLIQMLSSNLFCGLLINFEDPKITIKGRPIVEIVKDINIPIVYYGMTTDIKITKATRVLTDIHKGYEMMTDYLWEKGARRFAFAGIEGQGNLEKLASVQSALKKKGTGINNPQIFLSSKKRVVYQNGKNTVQQFPFNEIDAVICSSDIFAFGFINEAIRIGHRIPDDLFVTGCDNVEGCEHCIVPLTSIETYSDPLREKAVQTLIRKISSDNVENVVSIPSRIIERESA